MDPRLFAALAAVLVAFALVSRRAERSPITPPIVFLCLGWALGPDALGWIDAHQDRAMLHGLAEITLVLVLFTDASRIDVKRLRREESLPLRLLGIGLPLTIGLGAAVAMGVFPDLTWKEACLLGAILAPTDAALGQATVSSPLVPVRIRQTLNVESGLNDGIVLPVVLVFAAASGAPTDLVAAEDPASWVRFALLQVTLGPLMGIGVGYGGGRALVLAVSRGWVSRSFEALAALGLAVLAFAGAELVGGNGFIAAFVAGAALGSTARGICGPLQEFGEAEGQLLGLLVFGLFGAVILPATLHGVGLDVVAYALLSLTLIRMLPVALCLTGTGLRPTSIAFLGWFGPRGLASILFGLLVLGSGPLDGAQPMLPAVACAALASILLHGLSAYPLAARYSRYLRHHRDLALAEHVPVGEHAVRLRHGSRRDD